MFPLAALLPKSHDMHEALALPKITRAIRRFE